VLTRDVVDQARRAFSLFDRLETENLDQVIHDSDEVRLPAGTVLFRPGDQSGGFGL
jgi:hypothetical protein